ncbi:MAG: hypothetical protein H0W86_12930 [Armatimonadetes bacterium]|nr:hypothetical protein [Armatimonadota bacterium]
MANDPRPAGKLWVALAAGFTVAAGLAAYFSFFPKQSAQTPSPATKLFVGVYLQRSSGPMQTRFRLEVHPDGQWALANMLTGFWGTWELKDGKYLLTGAVGPSGKVEKPTPEALKFDGKDTVEFGAEGPRWLFDRMPSDEPYVIPLEGRKVTNSREWLPTASPSGSAVCSRIG